MKEKKKRSEGIKVVLECLSYHTKLQTEWKYKIEEGPESMARSPTAQTRYFFVAYVNRTWATEGIFKIIILLRVIYC